MGIPRSIIKQLDSGDPSQAETKAIITQLVRTAEERAHAMDGKQLHAIQQEETTNTARIPVSAVLGSLTDVRSFKSTESKNIEAVVKQLLDSLLNGTSETNLQWASNLVSSKIRLFLTSATVNQGEFEFYFIMFERLSLVRIDLHLYREPITDVNARLFMEQLVVVSAKKSVVDLAEVSLSSLQYIYQQQLVQSGMPKEEISRHASELAQFVAYAREISDSMDD